jgi:SAM-dependent methyltransferase
MKARESGMPDEEQWASFFDAHCLIDRLFVDAIPNATVAEFGCGYGTFSLQVAQAVSGSVFAFDIEPALIARLQQSAAQLQLANLKSMQRDFVAQGTGLADASVDHAMLYNILHLENPVALLREAKRILRPGGIVSVMHWRGDIFTPRGPSLAIRPSVQDCLAWGKEAGFAQIDEVGITDYAPYHYALVMRLAG